jgi:hypothetical protein
LANEQIIAIGILCPRICCIWIDETTKTSIRPKMKTDVWQTVGKRWCCCFTIQLIYAFNIVCKYHISGDSLPNFVSGGILISANTFGGQLYKYAPASGTHNLWFVPKRAKSWTWPPWVEDQYRPVIGIQWAFALFVSGVWSDHFLDHFQITNRKKRRKHQYTKFIFELEKPIKSIYYYIASTASP